MTTVMNNVLNNPPRSEGEPATVTLLGCELLRATEAEAVEMLVHRHLGGRGAWVLTANTDILRQWHGSEAIREMVREADFVVADGAPLIWASRLQGTPLPGRVCGSNLIDSVSGAAAEQGLKVFLLGGGEPQIAPRAAEELKRRYPALVIAGTHYPPFGFEKDPAQMQAMEAAIAAASPDVIFVALSFPKGERLIRTIRAAAPRAIWLGVGISFSFVCGDVKRAPRWVQRIGLEWVHRLVQEPRRLIRRYLIDDVPFALRLLCNAAAGRRRRL